MLIDKFIDLLLAPIGILLNFMPVLNINIPDTVFSVIGDVFGTIGYIVPWKGLIPLFIISFDIVMFRFGWAIILRIKSFIPTMGS